MEMRESGEWPTLVYRYGAPGWGGKRAITIGDHGRSLMRLAHNLGNDLVHLAESSDVQMREWWQKRTPVETASLDAAEEAMDQAWQELMRERSRQRRRDVQGPAKTAHADAVRARRVAFDTLKAAKAATRKANPDSVKAMQSRVRKSAEAAKKALYRKYASQGLYWATINAVIASAKTAEQRVISDRTKGRPARRRYKRWDGSGRLAVQLQRQADDPPRTPAAIIGGASKWRNVLHIGPSEYGPKMRRIEFSTGLKHPTVGVDVVWHRDIPASADICSAELIAVRIAGRTRYHVCITARVPPVLPVTSGPDVALHVGWRAERDQNGVRVATWRSTAPITVPDRLADIVVQDTPMSGRVILPSTVLSRLAAADSLRGARDVALDEARDRLVEFLTTHPQPPIREGGPDLTAGTVKTWRAPGRFAAIALAWRDDPREEIGAAAVALETWRVSDRRLWETEANGRARTVRYRREVYRLVAAWLASVAGRIVVDDTDLREIQAAPKTGALLPGTVEDRIAGRRADVAAGDLRATVASTAKREAIPVVTIPHKGLTVTHHACGAVMPPDERWLSAQVTCDRCGCVFDQDANATVGMLARAVQSEGRG
jgi:hypothetical protein